MQIKKTRKSVKKSTEETVELNKNVHPMFSEDSSVITLCDYTFNFLQLIKPECDTHGKIIKLYPQFNYLNKKNLVTHYYGDGPFCRFKINADKVPGVYLWVVDHKIIYIGETANLEKRINSGYGSISPKNCFADGQSTNCKMNKVVLDMAKHNKDVKLYFYQTKDHKSVEKELLKSVKPKPQYNAKH